MNEFNDYDSSDFIWEENPFSNLLALLWGVFVLIGAALWVYSGYMLYFDTVKPTYVVIEEEVSCDDMQKIPDFSVYERRTF